MLKERYHKKIDELITVKKELQDIFKVNHTLISTANPKKISSLITELTCRLMHTDACILRLINEEKKALVVNASFCISDAFIKKMPMLKVGESICGMTVETKRPLAVYDIDKDSRVKYAELIKQEGFKSMLSVPVVFQDKTLGAISTYSKKPRHFTEEEIEVLSIFASQVAIAIQESRHCHDLHMNYFNTIRALVLAIEAKDPYMRGHTERVTEYAIAVARVLKMPPQELEILRYAGELHDVGKISIPDFILGKPGKLTPAERAVIELHPVKGAEMLEPLEFLKPIIPIVRHHHERYDGLGYPDRLEKEKIPFMSRILACADAFDAMISDRPYRIRKLTVTEALSEIKDNSGSQFDPHIAHIFIRTIQSRVFPEVS
jgi:putative nucleotidyltransferase with HDIG domain